MFGLKIPVLVTTNRTRDGGQMLQHCGPPQKIAGGLTPINIERWINRSHTAILVLFLVTKICLIYVVSSPLTPPPHLSPPELSNFPFTLTSHCD